MITVTIQHVSEAGSEELAHLRLTKLDTHADGTADYTFELGVDSGEGFDIYQRHGRFFPRKKLNVLGLVRLALSTLEEKELTLVRDPDQPRPPGDSRRGSRNLARRLRGAL